MIKSIAARMILDSRGNPTVEATVTTETAMGVASVPSGASTGTHEAVELRDGDRRWGGLGVSKAVSHVNVEIAGALKGFEVQDQAALDQAMIQADGTTDKSRLGANAMLAVSLASLQAAAQESGQPTWQYVAKGRGESEPRQLPLPLCNVINGGAHADNTLDIQEFMIVPHGFGTFADALRASSETFHALKKLLKSRGQSTGVGDEGGFAPDLENHTVALDLMIAAITQAGYEPGTQISLALDVAASEFRRDGSYIFENQPLTANQLVALYASLIERYPIVSIEDPLGEDDLDGWALLRDRIGGQVQIVGDDLTVTNAARIQDCLDQGLLSAVILKPNQIGTVTETAAAWDVLRQAGQQGIVSHRSGETSDTAIADLAVGWGTSQIKTGSLSRGERVAKYNRLLQIEQSLGATATFAGNVLGRTR